MLSLRADCGFGGASALENIPSGCRAQREWAMKKLSSEREDVESVNLYFFDMLSELDFRMAKKKCSSLATIECSQHRVSS